MESKALWDNPYARKESGQSVNGSVAGEGKKFRVSNTTKGHVADENFRKVQRRKEEAAIMRGLSNNCGMTVDELKDQFHQQSEHRSESAQQQQLMAREERAASQERERPAPVQCVGKFEAEVRCLETTHGGATIWTGHDDGTLGIRNGVTGDCVYLIEAAVPPSLMEEGEEGGSPGGKTENDEEAPPPTVDVLYNAETHMWVGLSDGTIRIYDTLVYVLAFESMMHDGSITCFSNTFDGKVFSAAEDGTLIKWDTEAGNFDVLAHINAAEEPEEGAEEEGGNASKTVARCMCTYGYNGFAGGDTGTILQFDTETCATLQTYYGHKAQVNAVCVAEGFLISAGDDCQVFIWSIDTGSVFHQLEDYHSYPVKSLFSDTVAQRIWTTDTSGIVNIWEMSPSRFFPVVSCFVTESEAAVSRIKGVVAVDAVKLWSLGSDGRNKVWHSATNKIEIQTGIAVDAMSSIIAEDAIELAKWNELIRTMEAVAERMKKSMSTTLCTTTQRSEQRQYLYIWLQWLKNRFHRKKQVLNVSLMAQHSTDVMRRRSYENLVNFSKKTRDRKRKEIMAAALQAGAQRDLVLTSYIKMKNFYNLVRERQKRNALAAALAARSDRVLHHNAFYALLQYHSLQKDKARKLELSKAISACNQGNFFRSYLQRWLRATQTLKQTRGSQSQANLFCTRLDDALRARYMQTWAAFAHNSRNRRARLKASAMVMQKGSYLSLGSFFNKWEQFSLERRQRKKEIEYEEGKGRVAELLQDLQRVQHLTKRRRLLTDAQAAIDAALQNRANRKAKIADLHAESDQLEKDIVEKREGAHRENDKSMSEQVEDIIALLKVKVLNFHSDFILIHKTNERIKLDKGGVIKVFLEGHIAVKKVVVDMTKEPYLDIEKPWPLKEEQVKKLKSHYWEPVLNAIKYMVIAFDAMSPADRNSMSTESEIVMNGKWLILFATTCVDLKVKKLGGKSTTVRVKK